jgi:L-ascorbate metabolism protein UlaG (beta-lactamase superfamily)
MGVMDAIRAAKWVGVNKVVGVHYDTFDLIRIDHRAAVKSFYEAGMRLKLLDIGSVTKI